MTAPAISVVIPSYDGSDLLGRNLPPLIAELRGLPAWEILVADDGSTDGSAATIARAFPEVRVLPSDQRTGFAGTCNRGVRAAGHELVLCLNNDVRVLPGFLPPLVDALADPGAFAVGPRILKAGKNGHPDHNESLHRTFLSFGLVYHSGLGDVHLPPSPPVWAIPYACAAAVLFRRSVFLELGGFDELYAPFYWEDFDLCYRAWKRGWTVLYAPASEVRHEHRGTIGRLHSEREVETIAERNRILFAWKNLTGRGLFAGHVLWMPAKMVEAAAQGRGEVIAGLRAALRLFPGAWSRRAVERREARRSDRQVFRQFRADARRLLRAAR